MKIVFLEPLGIPKELLMEKMESAILSQHEIVYHDNRAEDTATLVERSQDADIVVLSNFTFGKDVMEQCPSLKLICVAFTGVDHIDLDYCKKRNISVCNCAGYSTVAVSDMVFGLVINLARNIIPAQERCRAGLARKGSPGFELCGKTFGVIGAGTIGTRVATIAKAFGCNVIAYSRTPKTIEGVKFVSMEELLKTSDIVSLHVPQTPKTIGLIGENELSMMKPTAMLINTARGPVVDSAALAKALKDGIIACAGLDVFDAEPPLNLNEPLLNAPNTLVTPHVAFASDQAFEKRVDILAKNISGWLDGKPTNIIE